MATNLQNYGLLKQEVEAWAFNSNPKFVQHVPMFIKMAERDLQRILRMPAQETEVKQTIVDNRITIPTDLIELKSIRICGGKTVHQTTFELLRDERAEAPLDGSVMHRDCLKFARHRNTYEFNQPIANEVRDKLNNIIEQGTDVTVLYYRNIEPMTADSDCNVFLHLTPTLLLYTALQHGAMFARDDDSLNAFSQAAAEELREVQVQLEGSELSAIPSKMPTRKAF